MKNNEKLGSDSSLGLLWAAGNALPGPGRILKSTTAWLFGLYALTFVQSVGAMPNDRGQRWTMDSWVDLFSDEDDAVPTPAPRQSSPTTLSTSRPTSAQARVLGWPAHSPSGQSVQIATNLEKWDSDQKFCETLFKFVGANRKKPYGSDCNSKSEIQLTPEECDKFLDGVKSLFETAEREAAERATLQTSTQVPSTSTTTQASSQALPTRVYELEPEYDPCSTPCSAMGYSDRDPGYPHTCRACVPLCMCGPSLFSQQTTTPPSPSPVQEAPFDAFRIRLGRRGG